MGLKSRMSSAYRTRWELVERGTVLATDVNRAQGKDDVCASHRVRQGKEPLQQQPAHGQKWEPIYVSYKDVHCSMCEVKIVSKPNTNGVTKPL